MKDGVNRLKPANTDILYVAYAALVAAKAEMERRNMSFDELLEHYRMVLEKIESEMEEA